MGSSSGSSSNRYDDTPCFSCIKCSVYLLLLIELILGSIILWYGTQIIKNGMPLSYVTIPILCFGAALLVSSIFGFLGFASIDGSCGRCALNVSCYLSIVNAIAFLFSGTILLGADHEVDAFVLKYADYLMVSDSESLMVLVDELNVLFGCASILVGTMEITKFFALRKVTRRAPNASVSPHDSSQNSLIQPLIPSYIGEHDSTGHDSARRQQFHSVGNSTDGESNTNRRGNYTSEDDFAPLDEELYTDPHWWAKSSRETSENDTSWITQNSATKYAKKSVV